MSGYDWVSTPSDAVARELERLGHKLRLVENMEYIPPGKFDFVWSPYESVTILGHLISDKLQIPHVAHIETIPPWRYYLDCDIENYGFPSASVLDVPDVKLSRIHYEKVGSLWAQAFVKTISNQSRLDMHVNEFGAADVQLRYPSVDTNTINMTKRMYSPRRENIVLTVARATYIKRYDLLVDVMNKVTVPITWRIIGDGPYIDQIKKRMTNKNVTLQFLGSQWGWCRYYEMMKAKVLLYAMGAMPPIEAALLGAFPICVEQQPTKHLPEFDKFMEYNFGNSMPIYKHTQIQEIADRIVEELGKSDHQSLDEYQTVGKFLSNELNVTSSMINAQQLIERFKNAH